MIALSLIIQTLHVLQLMGLSKVLSLVGVIHKVCMLGEERGGTAKSALTRIGEEGEVSGIRKP